MLIMCFTDLFLAAGVIFSFAAYITRSQFAGLDVRPRSVDRLVSDNVIRPYPYRIFSCGSLLPLFPLQIFFVALSTNNPIKEIDYRCIIQIKICLMFSERRRVACSIPERRY